MPVRPTALQGSDTYKMDEQPKSRSRPFIGILFECCQMYNRIYLNKAGTAFVGWCPRCAKKVELKVSPTGSTDRFFSAS